MPAGLPTGGGAPPGSPPGPPGGVGAATSPTPMAGAEQQAMAAVTVAMKALEKALPGIPMGSDLHLAIHKAIADISKHMDKGAGGDASATVQQLAQMAAAARQDPQKAAMLQKLSAGGGPAAAGGGSPAMAA